MADEYYSDIEGNEIGSFVEMWMNLEPIMQSEVSQKEKNKYHVLMHTYGIWKDGTDEPIFGAAIQMQT